MKTTLYIAWNDDNKLGIPIIDEQHRAIISTINSLYYFMQIGHGDDIIQPIMIILEQYVNIHFKTEETLIIKAKYTDIDEHCMLHKKLIEETRRLSVKANNNKDSNMI
jgi:hemerythrin